jgi:hypothetical protein
VKKITEGLWFGVPLRDEGFATGCIARENAREWICFGYFFGPRRLELPNIEECEDWEVVLLR